MGGITVWIKRVEPRRAPNPMPGGAGGGGNLPPPPPRVRTTAPNGRSPGAPLGVQNVPDLGSRFAYEGLVQTPEPPTMTPWPLPKKEPLAPHLTDSCISEMIEAFAVQLCFDGAALMLDGSASTPPADTNCGRVGAVLASWLVKKADSLNASPEVLGAASSETIDAPGMRKLYVMYKADQRPPGRDE